MKSKLLFYSLLVITVLPQISKAQFNTFSAGAFGQTTGAIRGIGIGNFSGGGASSTNARFHVNNFYCNQPNGTLNGFLFRTDGNNNVENKWQIFTGTNAGNATEKFKLYVPSGTSHTVLQTSQNGGNLMFNTVGAITKMVIIDGGTGATYIPNSLLNINDSSQA